MVRGKRRLGGIVAVAAAVLAIAFGFASTRAPDGASASSGESAPLGATLSAATPNLAKRLLLRLGDLPLGYLLLDLASPESAPLFGCARLEPYDPRPRLASFLKRYSPGGCMAVYFRLFRVPGGEPAPLLVGSASAELGSVEAAEAGLATSRELLAHINNDKLPREAQPPETVGEATRLFHLSEEGIFGGEEAVSILVWRWGGSIGLVLVTGNDKVPDDRAAVELARRQQKHLEAPTPYTPAERDDTEVPLEDPALEVPVYWLGSTFAPGKGFARLRLAEAFSTRGGSPREPRVGLLYTDRLSFNHAETVELDLWKPRHWKSRLKRSGLPFEQHCVKTRRLDLPGGRAVVYTGLHPGWRCNQRGPKVYTAVIRFPGVVIAAETREVCDRCIGAAEGPYNSFRGMATIARGLAPRLKPPSS
jgi:hypothetical protein